MAATTKDLRRAGNPWQPGAVHTWPVARWANRPVQGLSGEARPACL